MVARSSPWRLALAGLCLLLAHPALAAWRVAETPRFHLYGRLPAAELEARAALLDEFHALLVRTTGRDLPADAPPLDVFLVDRIEEAAPWTAVPPGTSGYYRADAGRISAVSLAGGEGTPAGLSAQQILLHEYGHHFLLGASRIAYPAWYVEGFAEYVSTATVAGDRIELGRRSPVRVSALARPDWIPMEALLRGGPPPRGEAARALFYAQSWLATHYLLRTPGMRPRLAAYLSAYAAGADPVEAFRRHVAADLPAFEARLRRHLRQDTGVTRLERLPAAARPQLRTLSPAGSDLLLQTVALEHAGMPGDPAKVRAAVEAAAAAHADDPAAARLLALMELDLGDPAAAGRRLDRLLDSEPDDADLLRWRARAARDAQPSGDMADARRLLAKAHALAPGDWRILHGWARLYRPAEGALPQPVLEALLKAHALAPQVPELVLDTALALAASGRVSDSARVLQPLANAPHAGALAEVAGRMLERAQAGDARGVMAAASAGRPRDGARVAMAAPRRGQPLQLR